MASEDVRDGAREPGDATSSRGYYVYVLRCGDGSLYSGITTDIRRRLREHRDGGSLAARYTRTHGVVALVGLWKAPDRSWASRLEWRLHHMRREEKLVLLAGPDDLEGPFHPASPEERARAWEASSGPA